MNSHISLQVICVCVYTYNLYHGKTMQNYHVFIFFESWLKCIIKTIEHPKISAGRRGRSWWLGWADGWGPCHISRRTSLRLPKLSLPDCAFARSGWTWLFPWLNMAQVRGNIWLNMTDRVTGLPRIFYVFCNDNNPHHCSTHNLQDMQVPQHWQSAAERGLPCPPGWRSCTSCFPHFSTSSPQLPLSMQCFPAQLIVEEFALPHVCHMNWT